MGIGTVLIIFVVLVVLAVIIIGTIIALYFIFRKPSALAANGEFCSQASDCQSNNCNHNTCQTSGTTTGTVNAACNANNSYSNCNSGLSCINGLCESTTCTPGSTPNGMGCSINSDCQSCHCNQNYCQPSASTVTGTEGASCNTSVTGGAGCNTGLSCVNNVCKSNSSSQLPNGSACSGPSDCQSGNCSTAPGGSQGYCQTAGVTTGNFNATCNTTVGCSSGLTCSTGGKCILDPSDTPWNGGCTASDNTCQLGLVCQYPYNNTAAPNDVELTCNYSTSMLSIPFSGYCPPGMTLVNTSSGSQCLASSKQSCNLNSQCVSNACGSGWGTWVWSLNTTAPFWQNLPAPPGPVYKAIVYNSGGSDVLRILVTQGGNLGLYDLNILSANPQWKTLISGLTPPGSCSLTGGGTISNFATSRDGATTVIAVQGLTGSFTLPTTTNTSGTVQYTAVMKIAFNNNGPPTCTPFYGNNPYPSGYVTAPGMILGLATTSSVIICAPSLTWTGSGPFYGLPLKYILDIDIVNDTNLLIAGVYSFDYPSPTGDIADISNALSFYYDAIPGGGGLPTPIVNYGFGKALAFPYATSASTTGGCGSWSQGAPIVQCNFNSSNGLPVGDISDGNLQNGTCYLQSAKYFRTFDNSSCSTVSFGGYTGTINQLVATGAFSPPDSWTNGTLPIGIQEYPSVPAVFANYSSNYSSTNILVLPTCWPMNNLGTAQLPPVVNGTLDNTFFVIDFDIGYNLNSNQIANMAMLVYYPDGQYANIVYGNGSQSFNMYSALPGYIDKDGRVASSSTAIYYLGPGICN